MTTTAPANVNAPPTGRRLWLTLISLMLAIVPIQLDMLVTATAAPTIAGDLGGLTSLAWISTAYLLTMAIGTVLSGRFGDMFGRKSVIIVALGLFLVGSAWAGLAGSMDGFIASRALQGLGAGMTLTSVIASVADIAPPEKRARYTGFFKIVAPVSMVIGPWVGGIVTDSLGWRWIFFFNIPLIVCALVGAVTLLPQARRGRSGRIDASGLAAVSALSVGAVLAISWGGNEYAWLSPQVIAAGLLGIAGIVALFIVEPRTDHPILSPALFRNPSVVLTLLVLFLITGAVMMASANFLPLFLQLAQGHSASHSGILLLPMLLPAVAVSLLVGFWADRPSRFKTAMIAGAAAATLACILLATAGAGTSAVVTGCFMGLLGAAIGLLMQIPIVFVQNTAPAHEVGAATGGASFFRMLGGTIGVGVLGSLFTSTVAGHIPPDAGIKDISSLTPGTISQLPATAQTAVADAAAAGNSAMFWAAACACALALLAALFISGKHTAATDSAE